MTGRTAAAPPRAESGFSSRLAWALLALTLALLAVALWLGSKGKADAAFFAPTMISFGVVGAFLARRRPHNALAWLFLLMGFGLAFGQVAHEYAAFASERPSVAGEEWAAWAFTWSIEVEVPFLVLILLLFPHGRPPSPRWRWVAWLTVVVGAVGTICSAVADVNFSNNFPDLRDPAQLLPTSVVGPIYSTYQLATLAIIAVSAYAMVVKLRRSIGEVRLQLKWFAYAAALVATGFLTFALVPLGIEPVVAFVVFVPLLPISAGVAVLKYRLYDIDAIINRTLVYGALTAVLAGVYAAGVVGLGEIMRSLTGQERNTLAVAASTLAVAALFRPARGRFQGFIDRRFYRRKYDAVKTLEAFSARLRDEVELDALTADLLAVVKDTMQPSNASLWLKEQTP